MRRTLIVSNRLPVTAQVEDEEITLQGSTGGLAAGLRGTHERSGGLWIGWPGEMPRLGAGRLRALDEKLASDRLVPIHLSSREVRRYYEGVSNAVLWPVFHYLQDRVSWRVAGWETYRAVNERFAETVAEHYRPGDLVWVNDYHLLLVPALLRGLAPDARIGFFLHIPFPSHDVFRVLPWRSEILHGLLGADLIAFHTESYARHFAQSLTHTLGLDADADGVRVGERRVTFGGLPMGVDSGAWSARADDTEVQERAKAIQREAGDRSILLGVDRLDYAKGIMERLLAIERLFDNDPSLAQRVRFIQVTVPSREGVEAYAGFRRRVDEFVGRLNGKYATPDAVPIHHLHQSLAPEEIAALYRAADALLVTSLRDGMNLVAKEFVAARTDGDGVLLLSEFTGAAGELRDALPVNPYDIEGTAEAIHRALTMPDRERRARMAALRKYVMANDVHRWSERFISGLERAAASRE